MSGHGDDYLEVHVWEQAGYAPLLFSANWQTALLNWEPNLDLEMVREIERHNNTDEVFVLLKGKAALFVATPQGLRIEDM